jgi:hypothetical protein
MKNKYILVLITLFSLTFSFAMGQTAHEINKLDKQVELALDSSAKHMVLFILTQNEAEYTTAMTKVTDAETMNNNLIEKAKGEKGVAGKIENEIIEDRKEEIESYKDQSIKSTVMDEKPADRKIKLKFKGQSYTIGSKSKKLYDLFSSYLPKN